MEEGFKDEFIVWCAERFEKIEFSPQAKAYARLYIFYLSGVLKAAISGNELWKTVTSQIESLASTDKILLKAEELIEESRVEPEPGNIALAIGAYCYSYIAQNKKSGEEFLTLFVNQWFKFYSSR